MIVVIGALALQEGPAQPAVAGTAGAIALGAAAAGATVQVIAKTGDDPAGDAILLALARGGVGHVATLRDASHATSRHRGLALEDVEVDPAAEPEPVQADPDAAPVAAPPTLEAADVALALRYLPDYRVVVVVHPAPDVLTEAVAATRWAGAHLVLVTDPAVAVEDPPEIALTLAVADADSDGVGPLIGRYAAAVDAGAEPASAFAATLGAAATA